MDPNTHKKSDFGWGTVGVNFDDIQAPEPEPTQNETACLFDQDPLEFEGVPLSPRSLPRSESVSMFDRLPEAFGEEDKLPYSWMARNPGTVAKGLENQYPRPDPLAARAAYMSVVNVRGEILLELQLKRSSPDANLYFFRVAAFCCIMDLNSAGLLYPSILAIFVGRLFAGDSVLMNVFNQYFMPPGLRIECITNRGAVNIILSQMKRHVGMYRPSSVPPNFRILIKVFSYMEQARILEGSQLNETVGKLVSTSNGREFHPNPGMFTILRGPALSAHFMKRTGEWWPYKDVTWQQADVLGLHTNRLAKRKDTVQAVDPRRLEVNINVEGDVRAEARGENRGQGSSRA